MRDGASVDRWRPRASAYPLASRTRRWGGSPNGSASTLRTSPNPSASERRCISTRRRSADEPASTHDAARGQETDERTGEMVLDHNFRPEYKAERGEKTYQSNLRKRGRRPKAAPSMKGA